MYNNIDLHVCVSNQSSLVTDDDDGTVYAPGRRPEWAKASESHRCDY